MRLAHSGHSSKGRKRGSLLLKVCRCCPSQLQPSHGAPRRRRTLDPATDKPTSDRGATESTGAARSSSGEALLGAHLVRDLIGDGASSPGRMRTSSGPARADQRQHTQIGGGVRRSWSRGSGSGLCAPRRRRRRRCQSATAAAYLGVPLGEEQRLHHVCVFFLDLDQILPCTR
jgi:hypothetical protein